MKKILFSAVMLSLTAIVSNAGFNDSFVQRQTEDGWLFHIFSQKMPSLDKKSKNMKYDFTYLEKTDSVTLLASIVTETSCTPDSLKITYCGSTYSAPAELVYLTPGKKKYDIRIKASIPYPVWNDIYSCLEPFVLSIYMHSENTSGTYTFGYDSKKWKSNREKNHMIINSIRVNTCKS